MSRTFDAKFDVYDTAGHRAAQQACVCSLRCAVDAQARHDAVDAATKARRQGDEHAIHRALAALEGPCCLPSVAVGR